MHYVIVFLAGFASALILVAIFGKQIDAKAKTEEQKLKAEEQKLKNDVKAIKAKAKAKL
jgi:uncharacterized membrane protein YciS (DUF1049 family)